jgi:hypothetical protein
MATKSIRRPAATGNRHLLAPPDDYHAAYPRRYLRATDLTTPLIRTITAVGFGMVADHQRALLALVMEFAEPDALPAVINHTNARAIAALAGSDRPADWVGLRIELFADDVLFEKQTVKGIRVRLPGAA